VRKADNLTTILCHCHEMTMAHESGITYLGLLKKHLLQVRSKKHCHRTDFPISPKIVGALRNVSLFTSMLSNEVSVLNSEVGYTRTMFLKLWSADHKWSSGSALVVLLD
jgi:hypothetical protein